jgi:hypothetical protein
MSTTDAAFQLIEIGRLHESPLNPRHTRLTLIKPDATAWMP